jgi:flagellar M-ring protein FliF
LREFLASFSKQATTFYKNLTPVKRASLLISFAVAFVVAIGTVFMLSGKTYVPLFDNVPSDQLAIVVSKLKEKNVPFEMEDGGKRILVPPEFVHATQMAIMTEGGSDRFGTLGGMGSAGLEIFEKQDFGTTSYAQRINFQRALQGELMRAINSLDVVRRSKVILALPARKTFLEEGGKPSASVVVDLYPGKSLSRDQVKGITYLTASSVENLHAEDVTVVDARGKVLSRRNMSGSTLMSSELNELKDRFEEKFESRIETILAKVVGQGKVIARVNADINLKDVTKVSETVDPDSIATRSVQNEEERLAGNRTNPVGVPGARANLPGAQEAGQVGFNQNVNRELKTTNYEVPKTITNTKEAPGKIEKLSIAVLVDGTVKKTAGEGGEATVEWVPRSEEELTKYRELVKNAIGFDEKRGDAITVENIQFEKEDFTEAEHLLNSLERRKVLSYLFRWGVLGLTFLLIFFLVIRPFMRWITDSFQSSVDDVLPKTIEELEELQTIDNTLPGMSSALPMLEESLDPDKAEAEILRERILGMLASDHKKGADALSLWLTRRE